MQQVHAGCLLRLLLLLLVFAFQFAESTSTPLIPNLQSIPSQSLLYNVKVATNEKYFCNFRPLIALDKEDGSYSSTCYRENKDKGLVYILPNGTETFPYFKDGTGIKLSCPQQIANGILNTTCDLYGTCKVICNGNVEPREIAVKCVLIEPWGNVSTGYNDSCTLPPEEEEKEEKKYIQIIGYIVSGAIIVLGLGIFIVLCCIRKKRNCRSPEIESRGSNYSSSSSGFNKETPSAADTELTNGVSSGSSATVNSASGPPASSPVSATTPLLSSPDTKLTNGVSSGSSTTVTSVPPATVTSVPPATVTSEPSEGISKSSLASLQEDKRDQQEEIGAQAGRDCKTALFTTKYSTSDVKMLASRLEPADDPSKMITSFAKKHKKELKLKDIRVFEFDMNKHKEGKTQFLIQVMNAYAIPIGLLLNFFRKDLDQDLLERFIEIHPECLSCKKFSSASSP